jgi:hypothetical protein
VTSKLSTRAVCSLSKVKVRRALEELEKAETYLADYYIDGSNRWDRINIFDPTLRQIANAKKDISTALNTLEDNSRS